MRERHDELDVDGDDGIAAPARRRMRILAVGFAVFAIVGFCLPSPWGGLAGALLLTVAGGFAWLHVWGSDAACVDVRRLTNQILQMAPD